MKYEKRRSLSAGKLLQFVRVSLPAWCWKLKFVRSWAERLAWSLADSQQPFISEQVQDAFVMGWRARHGYKPDQRINSFDAETRARLYSKDKGWMV